MSVERPPEHYAADKTMVSPVGHTRKERERLAVLERRVAHLVTLREQAPDRPGNDYDRAEEAALRWVLRRVADAERYERERGAP